MLPLVRREQAGPLFDGRALAGIVCLVACSAVACSSSPQVNGTDGAGGQSGGQSGGPSNEGGPAGSGGPPSTNDGSQIAMDQDALTAAADLPPVDVPDNIPPPRPPYDWMGVIGAGQSLAVGNVGTPTSNATSPQGLMLSHITGPPFNPDDSALAMVRLSEPIRTLVPLSGYPSAYPANIFGETPHTFMANQVATLYRRWNQGEYMTVHSVIGESGQGIAVISKGARDTGRTGRAYVTTVFEVKAIARLAKAAGKSYGIGAIVFTHGEFDATSKTYGQDVHQLWVDYNTDLSAITGQAASIPMLLTQQHSAPFGAGSAADSTVAAWRLGVTYPADFVCVGPKYQYQYASEGRHLNTPGYDRLGEKYGQVFYEKVIMGRDWQPLQPKTVTRDGKIITIDFHVPVGPLNWDDNIPPPHQSALTEWAKGRGFEVRNAAGRAAIDNVAIDGTRVIITLAADSQSTNWVVGYANAQDAAGFLTGPTRGRRGQLRDSDPFVGIDAATSACRVTNGSTQVQSVNANGFSARDGRDLALGAGLKAETIVVSKTSDSALTLSQPWTGPSGMADITFHSDQRNYAVAFEMPIP
jgi:hypothetical protein